VQVLIDGVLVGLVYGLVAISFVVIYRASRIVNLAQGEVLVFGALLLWTFTSGLRSIGYEMPLVVGLARHRCILRVIEAVHEQLGAWAVAELVGFLGHGVLPEKQKGADGPPFCDG
jgi:branched-subunit amino acid ABC-type transport system permease component